MMIFGKLGGCFVVGPNQENTEATLSEYPAEAAERYKKGNSDGRSVIFYFKKDNGKDFQKALIKAKQHQCKLTAALKCSVSGCGSKTKDETPAAS